MFTTRQRLTAKQSLHEWTLTTQPELSVRLHAHVPAFMLTDEVFNTSSALDLNPKRLTACAHPQH